MTEFCTRLSSSTHLVKTKFARLFTICSVVEIAREHILLTTELEFDVVVQTINPAIDSANIALWVISNGKSRSKVLNSKPCYIVNFYPKPFKPFLISAKLPKVYD